jgi:hypothetical protein
MTNENGEPRGHLLYDAYGGVLCSSLTFVLEEVLADQGGLIDPDTGLVHLGGGRWYDPGLGRPLQPDPVGGPPVVPQALNRYAATAVGQPGVGQAVASAPSFTNLSLATSFAKSTTFETLARLTWGPFGYARTRILREAYAEVSIRASHTTINNAAKRIEELGGGLLDPSVGLGKAGSGKYTRVFKLGQGVTTADDLIRSADLPTKGGWKAVVSIDDVKAVTKASRYAKLGWLSNARLGIATDVILSGGFQWYEDSYNPYFDVWQRGGRVGVAAGGSLLSSLAGLGAGSLVCGPGAGLCAAGVTVAILTAVTVNAIWSYGIQPRIFQNVEFLQPPPRNLKPLTTN